MSDDGQGKRSERANLRDKIWTSTKFRLDSEEDVIERKTDTESSEDLEANDFGVLGELIDGVKQSKADDCDGWPELISRDTNSEEMIHTR